MDTLSIEGMKFHAKHGYYEEEQEKGGNYIVDVYINADLSKAGKSDKLEDTINYEIIHAITKEVMTESKYLIEHIAYQIIEKIIETIKTMDSIRVKVSKLDPPLKGKVEKTTVELNRSLAKNIGYWAERANY